MGFIKAPIPESLQSYLGHDRRGFFLTDKFYDCGAAAKREIIEQMGDAGLLDSNKIYSLVTLALLQHTPRKDKARCPVQSERRLRPAARKADEEEAFEALFSELDRVTLAMFNDATGHVYPVYTPEEEEGMDAQT